MGRLSDGEERETRTNARLEDKEGRWQAYLSIGGGIGVARVSRPVSWRPWVRRPMPRNWGLCQVPMPPRMTDNSEMRPAARGERASLHTTHAAPNSLFERGLGSVERRDQIPSREGTRIGAPLQIPS
jgi:hypothetical protein